MSSRKSSPALTIASLWLVAIALVLYCADDVRGWIVSSPKLEGQPWAISMGNELVSISEKTGLPELRLRIEGLLRPPAERYVVLQKPPKQQEPERSPLQIATSQAGSRGDDEPSASPSSLPKTIRNVLLIGASSMQHQPGIELERLFGTFYDGLEVNRLGKVATGLARPDVFDWPKKARELALQYEPDLVVANFGGNDAQGMVIGKAVVKYGTQAWDDEYVHRLRELIEASRSRGARVVVLGMPIMRSPRSSEKVRHVNEITKRATEKAGEIYLSTWEIAADEHGAYRDTIEFNGSRGPMRQQDGWHYTRLGGEYMAAKIIERIEWLFPLRAADPIFAVPFPRELQSNALRRKASYLAYVPRSESGENTCYPTLFLLHGATGSWQDWPAHAHRELQRLSQKHGLVIVTPDGGAQGWYLDSPRIADSQYATHLMSEVLADVTAHFPVTEERAVAGLSAGGHGAITLSLTHPGTFVSASSMSGVLNLTAAHERKALIDRLGPYQDNRERWEQSSALHLVERSPEIARKLPLLVTVGASDRWAETNRHFAERLKALGIEHGFEESPGGHDWKYWTSQLPKHVEWHVGKLRAAAGTNGKKGGVCAGATARQ